MTEPRTPRRSADRRAATREPAPHRWPILLVLVLLVAGGVAIQRHEDAQPARVEAVSPDGLMPTAAAPGATSSTWYCAAGTATGESTGAAEQTLEIANDSGTDLTARVTIFPGQAEPVERDEALPAHSRVDVIVSSIVKAPYASALVEVEGGEVAVSHLLEGPTGRSVAACSSSPSASWSIPSGTTRAGTSQLLAVFNPFPSEAVLGVTFEADDGARSPQDFEAVVVPGRSVSVLDIGAKVTLRNQLATTVTVRSGRVVVDQIQTADGTQGTTKSLTVTPAAPRGAPTWWFADGPAESGASTVFYVQNTGTEKADVELQIRLDDTVTYGDVEPFSVSVDPGRYEAIDVSGDGRVPPGVGYTAVAQATNGVDIVADRVVGYASPATPTGATVTLGSPVLADRWIVPAAALAAAGSAKIIVTNPSATDPVTVTVSTVADGQVTPLPGMAGIEVLAGGRGGFDVPTGTKQPQVAVDVTGGAGVVVELTVQFSTGGRAAALAVPVAGTNQVATAGLAPPPPPDSSPDSSPDLTVPDGSATIPEGTTPPGTGG
jgi:hypothetical protein